MKTIKTKYKLTLTIGLLLASILAQAQIPIYKDTTKNVAQRVADLMKRMTPAEKIKQLESQMLYSPDQPGRDYTLGNTRDIAHFIHGNGPVSATGCAAAINNDTKKSIAASRFKIPVLQHEESLHGAQWGMATVFPQSIGMAASFDDSLYFVEGKAVTEELRAVGIRQVLAPVVNIARDARWGRMEESYGEDVLLTSRMGVAYSKALEQGGVIATPKHFADNYAAGGHDSYASDDSWRTEYEVYLEPFRACFQEGGAQSVMAAYNSIDGVPCSSNTHLLNDILRKEWHFKGFVVSDYGGVKGVATAHNLTGSYADAEAMCLKAGLDVELPNGYRDLDSLYKAGKITIQDINKAVKNLLTAKFRIGLYDHPYADTAKADQIVRSISHRQLALQAARETMTLLKNEYNALPLKKDSIKTIGIFGPAANILSLGDYAGPYAGWKGEGAVSPCQGLQNLLKNNTKLKLYQQGDDLDTFVKDCDVLIFFAGIQEGEGSDRSGLNLPAFKQKAPESKDNAIIAEHENTDIEMVDQEGLIRALKQTKKKLIVVLQNGAPVDVRNWQDGAAAILEAWYPGEQGGTAIAETLFGDNNPGGRLPVSWLKSVGQEPLYYAIKPSGRNYDYSDDDGKPIYPFGYGLSYTTFSYSKLIIPKSAKLGKQVIIQVTVTNTGKVAGDEVVQLYVHRNLAPVVMPLRELKAFKRVRLNPGESRAVTLYLPARSFGYYDQKLHWVEPPGNFDVWICRNAVQDILKANLKLKK